MAAACIHETGIVCRRPEYIDMSSSYKRIHNHRSGNALHLQLDLVHLGSWRQDESTSSITDNDTASLPCTRNSATRDYSGGGTGRNDDGSTGRV